MKLVIQIPCLDESQTLPATLRDLPTALPGIDDIRVIVVGDGSQEARLAAITDALPDTLVVAHVRRANIAIASSSHTQDRCSSFTSTTTKIGSL